MSRERDWVVLYQQSVREWRWGHLWQGLIYVGLALGAIYGILVGLRTQDPLVQRAMFVFVPICCFGIYRFSTIAWRHLADMKGAKLVVSGRLSHLESKGYTDVKNRTQTLYLLTVSSQVFEVPSSVHAQLSDGQHVKIEAGRYTKEVAVLYVQQ